MSFFKHFSIKVNPIRLGGIQKNAEGKKLVKCCPEINTAQNIWFVFKSFKGGEC